MKISIKINAVLAHCTFCFIFNNLYNKPWNWHLFCLQQIDEKKVKLNMILSIKQQFNELINGEYQINKR